jgi:hypothetical protein
MAGLLFRCCFGHEIGRWEGDTFVVDAIAFKGEQVWIDENANPHSDQLHVVERWTRTDSNTLEHVSLIEDPKFYTKPFQYTRTFVIGVPGQTLGEYACSENPVGRDNLGFGPGPIRPDGQRGYIDPAPLPPLPTPVKREETKR